MSSAERQELAALIEYNLDMTKKSQLPFFWYPELFIYLILNSLS
jgi:hypothetical protein